MDVLTKRVTIEVVQMPTADTQYKWTVPPYCNAFSMKTRLGSAFRRATETGKVAPSNTAVPVDPYKIQPAGVPYAVDNLKPEASWTYYFASSVPNEAMEIDVAISA